MATGPLTGDQSRVITTDRNGNPLPGGPITQGGINGGSNTTNPVLTPGSAPANAYEYLKALFESYGLGTLAPLILNYAQQGYSQDTIQLMLQQSQEWKTRFAGNEIRKANGMSVLDPASYLGLEESYRQVLTYAGLPSGFYDQPSDFADWIGGDASPKEIEDRVGIISKWVNNSDPAAKQALLDYYGIGDSELIAYGLDRTRAEPLLQKQAAAAEIGAAGIRQGMNIDKDTSELYAMQGANPNNVAGAAQVLPDAQRLGEIYGQQYTQADALSEFLGGTASAQRKRLQLAQSEANSFTGATGGVNSKSLGKGTAGSY